MMLQNYKGSRKGADPEGEFEMIVMTNHTNVDRAAILIFLRVQAMEE